MNRHLLESFKEENDPLEIPRPVKHWAYFSSREAREKFVELAICDGFQLDHVFEPDERYGAVVTRTDSIDSRSINDVVWTLFDFAEEAGGEYDGWESSIVIEDMS